MVKKDENENLGSSGGSAISSLQKGGISEVSEHLSDTYRCGLSSGMVVPLDRRAVQNEVFDRMIERLGQRLVAAQKDQHEQQSQRIQDVCAVLQSVRQSLPIQVRLEVHVASGADLMLDVIAEAGSVVEFLMSCAAERHGSAGTGG